MFEKSPLAGKCAIITSYEPIPSDVKDEGDGKVYVGDEDGDITVCKHGKKLDILSEVNMGNSVYSTPVVANNTLFIANKTHLFAIQQKD